MTCPASAIRVCCCPLITLQSRLFWHFGQRNYCLRWFFKTFVWVACLRSSWMDGVKFSYLTISYRSWFLFVAELSLSQLWFCCEEDQSWRIVSDLASLRWDIKCWEILNLFLSLLMILLFADGHDDLHYRLLPHDQFDFAEVKNDVKQQHGVSYRQASFCLKMEHLNRRWKWHWLLCDIKI